MPLACIGSGGGKVESSFDTIKPNLQFGKSAGVVGLPLDQRGNVLVEPVDMVLQVTDPSVDFADIPVEGAQMLKNKIFGFLGHNLFYQHNVQSGSLDCTQRRPIRSRPARRQTEPL